MSRRIRTLFPLSLLAHCLTEYKQCVVFSQSMRQRMGAKTTKKKKITLVSMPKPRQLDRSWGCEAIRLRKEQRRQQKRITGLTIEEIQLTSTTCCNPSLSVPISFLHFFSLSITTRPLSTEALYRETCDDKSTGVKVSAAAMIRSRARCWLHRELVGGFDVLTIELG